GAEEAVESCPPFREGPRVELELGRVSRCRCERRTAVARGAAEVEHAVGDRRGVDLWVDAVEPEAPVRDRAGVLEGEVALVLVAEFEQAAVVLCTAGDDLGRAARIGDEAWVGACGVRVA